MEWEYHAAQFVDFQDPFQNGDGSGDEWFDIDRENESHRFKPHAKIGTKMGNLEKMKSPLQDLTINSNSENKFPARRNIFIPNPQNKHPEAKRHSFHMKTKLSAGRQAELKRKSLTKQLRDAQSNYSTISSVSSKSSRSSKAPPNSIEKETNFVETLRLYDSPEPGKKFANRATVPIPFSFGCEPIKKNVAEEFRSLAQQVIAYHTKTPLRFRTRPRRASTDVTKNGVQPHLKQLSHSVKKCYVPHSPDLHTKTRKRSINVLSQQDIENQEYEKMKSYRFHANPFKDAIFQKSYANLPEKQVKRGTVIKPFSFHVNVPFKPSLSSHSSNESISFRAGNIPNDLFKRPLGIPNVPKRPPVPVKPFSFLELDKARQRMKEQKINKYYEEEKRLREFRANPLPNLEVKGVPDKQPKPKTVVQPFDFLANERDLHKLDKKRFTEELKRLNEPFVFKAKAPFGLVPFVPQKPNRFLTCTAAPSLHTEKRASERETFNQALMEKEAKRQAQEEQMRLRRLEEEMEIISEMRSSAVHRAKPIRQYKSVERPLPREPTEPKTPTCLKKFQQRRSAMESVFSPSPSTADETQDVTLQI